MTDNEIIKALECCLILHKCEECPCDFDTNGKTLCKDLGLKIFDLIKRRQIYIERLQEYYRRYNGLKEETEELRIEVEYAREKISQMEEFIITVKSEAVREFAEKLKEHCNEITNQEWNKKTFPVSWADAYEGFVDDIDRLVEEMRCNNG